MRLLLPLLLLTLALPLAACGASESSASRDPIVIDDRGSEGGEGGEGAGEGRLVVSDDACTTDADCVPAGCCHAAACVAQASAPDCADVMCTTDCQYGTLDCGGACLCHEGRCAARLSVPPELRVEGQ